jgi:hypothetical protein
MHPRLVLEVFIDIDSRNSEQARLAASVYCLVNHQVFLLEVEAHYSAVVAIHFDQVSSKQA